MGSPAKALDLLQPDPPANIPEEVFWYRKLIQAYALCQLKDYAGAEDRFSQAGHLIGERHDGLTEIAYFRGRCALLRREWQKAEEYFHEVIRPGAASDLYLKAYALAGLGWSSMQDLRYEEAIDWYGQDETAARALNAIPLEEQALGNLGFLYAQLHDFAKAEKNSADAESIASQLHIPRDEQHWLLDVGRVQNERGHSGAAEETYKRALALATKFDDRSIAAKCLHNLTSLKIEQGDLELAQKFHQMGYDLGLTGDDLELWRLDQAKILKAHADFTKAMLELRELLQQIESEDQQSRKIRYALRWYLQDQIALLYAVLGNAAEAERWFQSGIATVDEAAKNMQSEEFQTSIRDNMPVFDDYVAFLVNQKQPAKALQVAQLGRARTLLKAKPGRKVENVDIWVGRIQAYLRRSNAILFSYFATQSECYLWVVTSDQVRLFPLGKSGPDLDNLIESYRQEIQQHLPIDASPASKTLFQVLVQPASELIPRGAHVIVIADSQIYSVNFETLISPHISDHYWIEDVDIQNASSIDLLTTQDRRRIPTKGLLLIGAAAQADPDFAELPHAPEEMESVRRHFPAGETTAFTGKNATPGSYLQSHPGSFKFIHLATHGTPNALEPLESAIILSSDAGGKFKLLGRDIVKVPLNAELVTISACEGVGTNIQSLEGLLGLEWAFMRAGAHQVVAALWDVDDSITPGLMDDFYGELQKGRTAADALRHAKLAMLHAGGFHATPYYWAALQLYTRS
ncbi:MAG TPA: CHAT domain-containing tetratricopeptide repeat protein [Candidatus Angelobacter sp.]